jgi:hypothetical protein
MIRKLILILSLFLPLLVLSQDYDEDESGQEIPIGSSGIDLAPVEEISTPTEPSSTASEPTPAPTSEQTTAPTESAPASESTTAPAESAPTPEPTSVGH